MQSAPFIVRAGAAAGQRLLPHLPLLFLSRGRGRANPLGQTACRGGKWKDCAVVALFSIYPYIVVVTKPFEKPV